MPGELPDASGDPGLLSIALYNAVGNACKFTPPQGRGKVVVRQEDEWATVAAITEGRLVIVRE